MADADLVSPTLLLTFIRFYVHEAGQPNQLKKRIEMREKLRQRHRRTKSTDAPSLHDSDQPLYSVPTSNLSPTSNLDSSARSKGGEGLRWSSNDEPTGSLPCKLPFLLVSVPMVDRNTHSATHWGNSKDEEKGATGGRRKTASSVDRSCMSSS